jgi:hypothetical protein
MAVLIGLHLDSTTVEGAYSPTNIAKPSPRLISASPTWEVNQAQNPLDLQFDL